MVTGIDYKRETETFNQLSETVATELSKSGVAVSTADFAACHRNGNRIRNITRNGKTVKTVTVRFYNCHKKDNVLNSYKNHENGKHKKVKVVQSLNTYYQNLKTNVSNFCRDM